jgi:hypothetical protein
LDTRQPKQHAATADDGCERRAQLMRDAADQRIAQNLGAIVERRLLDRLLGLEVFERQRRLRKQRFYSSRRGCDRLAAAVAEIDPNGAIAENLRIDDAHQPGAPSARIDDGRGGRCFARDQRDRLPRHLIRDGGVNVHLVVGRDQHGLVAQRVRHIVLHREDQVAAGQAGGERLREGMQLGHLLLAALERHGLVFQPRREIARYYGDQQKQDQVHDVLRIADPESVERRIEEEIRSRGARDRGDNAEAQPPLGRGKNDRQHVDEGDQIERDEIVDDDEADGGEPHQRQRGTERHRLAGQKVRPLADKMLQERRRATLVRGGGRGQRRTILAFLKRGHLCCLSGGAQ